MPVIQTRVGKTCLFQSNDREKLTVKRLKIGSRPSALTVLYSLRTSAVPYLLLIEHSATYQRDRLSAQKTLSV